MKLSDYPPKPEGVPPRNNPLKTAGVLSNNKVDVDEDVDVGKNNVYILLCSCFNWL